MRFASWELRSRLQDEVLFDWVEGQRLSIRHGMTGATGNIYVGLHEFFDMIVPLHFLRRGDLFLDVGANVGTYAVLASDVCGAKTIAFEPDPGTFCHLRRNVEINHLDDRVQVYNCAVGAAQGDVVFTVGLDTKNRVANDQDSKTRTVRMETLDEMVSDSVPIMMKIDVEGAEQGVLEGAKRILSNPLLKVIELESVAPESARILASNGFEEACYEPFQRTLSKHSNARRSLNALFVRDWLFVADRLQTGRTVTVFGRTI